MKFRFRRSTEHENGSRATLDRDYERDEIVVGRGGGSDIIIRSKLVEIEHVRFTLRDGSLHAEDLCSYNGMEVNGVLIETASLKPGDRVGLGDTELSIFVEDEIWGVEISQRELPPETPVPDLQVPSGLEISRRMPNLWKLSAAAACAVLFGFFGLPYATGARGVWTAGPTSNQHVLTSAQCSTCHSSKFSPVAAEACLSCHAVPKHVQPSESGADPAPACTTCHVEHAGSQGLTSANSSGCSSCHGLSIPGADEKAIQVRSLARHPEFRISAGPEARDAATLKMNHKLHLSNNLQGSEGGKSLNCQSCHRPAADGKGMQPVKFSRHCADCHTLGFDERLPSLTLPHQHSDMVFNFMFAEYSKLYLATEQERIVLGAPADFNLSLKPGFQKRIAAGAEKANEFARDVIVAEARYSEAALFTRAACAQCHTVREREVDPLERVSKFEIVPVKIAAKWFPNAKFDHRAHAGSTCLSCHPGSEASESAADISLPGVAACQNCHHDNSAHGKVESQCTQCHVYHRNLNGH